jgi:hypothetical protein
MGTSQFDLSEHDAALLKKFQGNGWALTCSEKSQKELSAILGEGATPSAETKSPANLRLPVIRYEEDWADTVLRRSMSWKASDGKAPLWLTKATEDSDCALFQLPSPDNRWIVKFGGKILEPFSYRLAGWSDLHEIMVHGFMLDRTALIEGHSSLADLRKQGVNVLTASELVHAVAGEVGVSRGDDNFRCSFSGTKLHGLQTQTPQGSISADRWTTCADDFDRQLHKRLERVFDTIQHKGDIAASVLRRAIRCKTGCWSFNDSFKWMTSLREFSYDAKMVFNGRNWEIEFPDSSELLTVPDSVGIRSIARILMCNNIASPCALVADGPLLSEFLSRPQHHNYFDAIYRRPRVICGDAGNGELEQSICNAMRLRIGWHYSADHVVTEKSELHTVCGLPTGKVTLKRADALEGVRDLIKRYRARRFFCAAPGQRFEQILADIEAGIEFARKHENLLDQVQSTSEDCQEKVRKAIYRLDDQLGKLGDWTTRYDRLASHFSEYIRGGLILQYTGPYRWRIEGLPHVPDAIDLAADHIAFKRRKVFRAKAKITRNNPARYLSRAVTAS